MFPPFYFFTIIGIAVLFLENEALASTNTLESNPKPARTLEYGHPEVAKRQVGSESSCRRGLPRFVGCYNRDLRKIFQNVYHGNTMTESACKNSCFGTDFSFAAVDGVWCFCGSEVVDAPLAKRGDDECDSACPGVENQQCGGGGLTWIWFCSSDPQVSIIQDRTRMETTESGSPMVSSTTVAPDRFFIGTTLNEPSVTVDPVFVTVSTKTKVSTKNKTVTKTKISTKTEVSTTTQIIFITAVPIQTQVTAISQIQTATKSIVTLPVQNPNTRESFSCPDRGFIMNETGLFTLDLNSRGPATRVELSEEISSPGALAYNILDHNLYLIELSSSNLLRVSADGSIKRISMGGKLDSSQFGDIDNLGQYWIATGFDKENKSNWTQIDLNPYSPKFGEIVNTGTTKRWENGPVRISNWVSTPSAGRILWSLAACDPDSEQLALWKFELDTGNWYPARRFSHKLKANIKSCFGSDTGQLLCIAEDGSRYMTNVKHETMPPVATWFPTGPSDADWLGNWARCVLNTQEISIQNSGSGAEYNESSYTRLNPLNISTSISP
ncbi:hypothetical protein TWF569_011570 [Orbilia oligospora]|nr:hypothetical protein TWF569_011570 [Orbilia oligospora]KAF3133107.1 hypothetical protein TWF594_009321 [Orbilia oligospora]